MGDYLNDFWISVTSCWPLIATGAVIIGCMVWGDHRNQR
jgi:hypothetical protein